ncbi:hypothetical protein JCM8547_003064 [Rhodosporidiobolus lusitaniae]
MADSTDVYDTLHNQTIASEDFARHILGPHLIGWTLQIALWGAGSAGALDYVRLELWHRDPLKRKMLLGWVYLWCTLQAAFNMFLLFHWTTTQDRDASSILKPSVINALQPLTAGATAVPLLQSRWAKRLVYAAFCILIAVQAAFQVFNVVLNYLSHADKLNGELYKLVTFNIVQGIWLWAAAVADLGLTITLVLVLRKRIAGIFPETDSMLNRLAALAIQSASYTAFFAVTAAILSYAIPSSTLMYSAIPFAFWYLLPSCYFLSLLTTLSSRLIFAKSSHDNNDDSVPSPVPLPLPRFSRNHALTVDSASRAICTCGARPSRLSPGSAGLRRSGVGRTREKREGFMGGKGGIRVQEKVDIVVEDRCGTRITLPALSRQETDQDAALEKGNFEGEDELRAL